MSFPDLKCHIFSQQITIRCFYLPEIIGTRLQFLRQKKHSVFTGLKISMLCLFRIITFHGDHFFLIVQQLKFCSFYPDRLPRYCIFFHQSDGWNDLLILQQIIKCLSLLRDRHFKILYRFHSLRRIYFMDSISIIDKISPCIFSWLLCRCITFFICHDFKNFSGTFCCQGKLNPFQRSLVFCFRICVLSEFNQFDITPDHLFCDLHRFISADSLGCSLRKNLPHNYLIFCQISIRCFRFPDRHCPKWKRCFPIWQFKKCIATDLMLRIKSDLSWSICPHEPDSFGFHSFFCRIFLIQSFIVSDFKFCSFQCRMTWSFTFPCIGILFLQNKTDWIFLRYITDFYHRRLTG